MFPSNITFVLIFVKFIPLWYVMLKLTYALPSTTINFIRLAITSVCFGRTDHPQSFKYMILRFKNKMLMYFKFRKFHQLC
jgi:hypothetical protein